VSAADIFVEGLAKRFQIDSTEITKLNLRAKYGSPADKEKWLSDLSTPKPGIKTFPSYYDPEIEIGKSPHISKYQASPSFTFSSSKPLKKYFTHDEPAPDAYTPKYEFGRKTSSGFRFGRASRGGCFPPCIGKDSTDAIYNLRKEAKGGMRGGVMSTSRSSQAVGRGVRDSAPAAGEYNPRLP
jgi:hypothetical protein